MNPFLSAGKEVKRESAARREAYSQISKMFTEDDGKLDAQELLDAATIRANARAAKLLAAQHCPSDLVEWGRAHGIPTFAEYTWQAGFEAGMRCAMLKEEENDKPTT